MSNARIFAIADVFEELAALVNSEPALAQFASATTELCVIGRSARAGEAVELTVSPEATARIPTRELAEQILNIVIRAPGPIVDEDEETKRKIAVMHINLVRAVVHAIFVDYPDLMRAPDFGKKTSAQ
jgi:hypothetical protein